jgi:hypothetical protein
MNLFHLLLRFYNFLIQKASIVTLSDILSEALIHSDQYIYLDVPSIHLST